MGSSLSVEALPKGRLVFSPLAMLNIHLKSGIWIFGDLYVVK